MTSTSPVGIHTTADAMWSSFSGVLSRTPARSAPDAVDILGCIDDRSITSVDGRDVEVASVLSGLFAEALDDAGARGGDHDLVLVHPPHWGAVRCGVLAAAARPLARDVLLVSSALVARDAAESARPCPCGETLCRTVVLDRTPRRTTVSTVVSTPISSDVVDCVLTDPTLGEDDDVSVASARVRCAVDGVLAAAPACRLVVHGAGESVTEAVLESLGDLTVVTVDDDEMTAAVVPSASPASIAARSEPAPADQIPQVDRRPPPAATRGRTGAWLADRAAAAAVDRRRAARRPVVVATIAAALVCVSVGVAALTRGETTTNEAAPPRPTSSSSDAAESVPAESVPADTIPAETIPAETLPSSRPSPVVTTTPAAAVGREFTVAGTRLTVPPGWHVEPGTERVELRPDTAAGMRVVVVVRELGAGLGLPDVQASLSARVDAAPDRLDGLDRRSDVAAYPALVYTENASDGTTVTWTVIVSPGEQTSVGCQGTDAAAPVVTEVCAAVLDSLVVG